MANLRFNSGNDWVPGQQPCGRDVHSELDHPCIHGTPANAIRVRGTLARVDGELVVTEPKTAKSKRFVPISGPAEALLRVVHAVQQDERQRAGEAWREHSAASVMLTGGVPLKVVSEILGHSSIAITGDIYGHVSPDVARQAMDLLGNALDR
jgi:integrase